MTPSETLALTAYVTDDDSRKSVASGFDLHVAKPMTDQALKASSALLEDGVYANVIVVTSPGRLYRSWNTWQQAGVTGNGAADWLL